MICAIHQPQTFPWLGYFAKIIQADIFVFLDNVQFKKNEWQNRNKLKTNNGWNWLTVPVLHNFGQDINEVKINSKIKWKRKHLQTIKTFYGKTDWFRDYFPELEKLYENDWEYLSQFNIEMITWMMEKMGIETPALLASEIKELQNNQEISADERLVLICNHVKSMTYLSGVGGRNYLNADYFMKKKIKLFFQEFSHPRYTQQWGDFVSHLSALDLLFNKGRESFEIITKGIK